MAKNPNYRYENVYQQYEDMIKERVMNHLSYRKVHSRGFSELGGFPILQDQQASINFSHRQSALANF